MATVVFFPEGAFGPTNNCVGIGQVLRDRGHRVMFVIEESFAGSLEAQGFEERLMRLGPPAEIDEEPGQFWKDFIRETAPVFRKPTIDQLEGFIAPTFEALIEGARRDDRLELRFRPEAAADVRDLVRAERECCPFLSFEVEPSGEEVRLAVTGPAEAVPILDALLGQMRS